jgi:hypothetical protein
MVRIDHYCVQFFRAAHGKTAHNEHVKYHSAEGSEHQLRKSYIEYVKPLDDVPKSAGSSIPRNSASSA